MYAVAVALLGALAAGGWAGTSFADMGMGNPVEFYFGNHTSHEQALGPTLYGSVIKDPPTTGPDYEYTAKGFLKVHGNTVARLPSFSGHADGTRRPLRFALSRKTRHTIRAAAKRTGSHRVTLTITAVVTTDDDAQTSTAIRQDSFLRIPSD
jgi:hypothetical protein